jgi:predicted branched-subunit amino acid permease
VDPRSAAIVLGYVPVALAFGITGTAWHLPFGLILGLSLLVYAGASQFAVVPLLAGPGFPWVAVSTAWLVNTRMAVESASFAARTEWPRRRPWALFWLTDEVFVTAALTGVPPSPRRFLALALPPYIAWGLATAIGAYVGGLLPAAIDRALTFSLYGLYLSLVVLDIRQEATTLVAAMAGALGSLGATALGLGHWGLVAGAFLGGGAYWATGVLTPPREPR